MDNPAANLANDLGALSLTPVAAGTARPASNKARNPQACLTGLPPELHLIIYNCVLENIEQLVLPYSGSPVFHPLAHTNRLLGYDFLPVFEGSDFPAVTTIEASIKDLNFRTLNSLWRRITPSSGKVPVWMNLLITSEAVAKTHTKDVAEWCSLMDAAFVEASRGQEREFYWMSDSSDSEEDDSESDWSGGEGADDFCRKEGEGYVRRDKWDKYRPGLGSEDDDESWKGDNEDALSWDEEDDDDGNFESDDEGSYSLSSEDDDEDDTTSEAGSDKVISDERPEYLRFPCGYNVILAPGKVNGEQLDDLAGLLHDMSKDW